MVVTDQEPADGELTDAVLHQEIELVGDLVIAATSADGPLSRAEIDLILGVDPSEPEDAAGL